VNLGKSTGCSIDGPPPTVDKKYQLRDFILVWNISKTGISRKSRQLYAGGYSIQAIAQKLGISRWQVREALKKEKIPLRSQSESQRDARGRPKDLSSKCAPYGYCLVNGKPEIHPAEWVVVRRIEQMWRLGMSGRAIAQELNIQKVRPRTAKK